MADLGEIRAKLVAETDQFEAGMGRAADAAAGVAGAVDETNKSLKAMNFREAGRGIEQFGSLLKGLGDEVVGAAASLDDLSDSLKGAFGDSADQVADWSNKIGTAFGVFTKEQIGGAAVALEKFGQTSEVNLQRVADIAAGTGGSLEGIATALGKFQKFSDDPNKVAGALAALQKQTGVTAAELAQFGAVLDSNGKVLADTPARAMAARDAMAALLDDKFGGAMAAQSDDAAKLAGSFELLKQELGASAFEAKESMAPALLSIVEGFRGLSPEIKGAVGLVAEFGGAGLQVAGTGLQMAANLSTLGLSVTGIKTAFAAAAGGLGQMATGVLAMTGPIGILIVSLTALAAGLMAVTAETEKANKAAEALLKTDEQRTKNLQRHKDLIGKTTDELKKMGATQKDVNELIAGLQDAASQASPEQRAKIQGQIQALRKSRNELPADKPAPGVEPAKPARVEESEKAKAARLKKEAAAKAAADKRAEAAKKKAEREEAARKRREEAKRRADEAKRQREQTAREKAADRKRQQAEKAREREQAKQQREQAKQAAATQKDTEKKTAAAKAPAAAAQAAATAPTAPGFFDQFGDSALGAEADPSSAAFREKRARNAAHAAAANQVFLSDKASKIGADPFTTALLNATSGGQAISPEAAAAASSPSKVGASGKDETAQKQGATGKAEPDAFIVLEVRDQNGKTLRHESRGPGPHKFNLTAPLGGLSG